MWAYLLAVKTLMKSEKIPLNRIRLESGYSSLGISELFGSSVRTSICLICSGSIFLLLRRRQEGLLLKYFVKNLHIKFLYI